MQARCSKSCVLIGYLSGQDGPILPTLVPQKKKLLEAGLHSSLTLQNETIYKTFKLLQVYDKVKCMQISLLWLNLKIMSGNICQRIEGDTW